MNAAKFVITLVLLGSPRLSAIAPGAELVPVPTAAEAAPPVADSLSIEQGRIADKYARLEQLMVRMAEIEAASNPQRAGLLRRAVEQSSERLIRQQLNATSQFLAPPAQLSRAIEQQEKAVADLQALLELLLSENRSDRLKDDQARYREYIKEVERLLRLQRGVQGRTEGGDDPLRLKDEQAQLEQRTGELAEQMGRQENQEEHGPSRDGGGDSSKDAEPQKPSPAGKQPTPGKTQDQKADRQDAPDREKQDAQQRQPEDGASPGDPAETPKPAEPSAEKTPSQPGGRSPDSQPSESQPSQQPPRPGGESPDQPPQQGTPSDSAPEEQSPEPPTEQSARKRLEAAQQRMREAEKRLEEAKRNEAVEQQEAAQRELEKAKAELEEILRQLREEEVERTLALLESRFRRMLEMQTRIYEATKKLDEIPIEKREREVDIQASRLSFDESKLVAEADKALLLLREEGSSIAFPETVDQIRDDMLQIVDRLAASKVDPITQGYEQDVIDALDEMVQALQKAQKDLEEQKQREQQQKSQPVSPDDMPLVDQLAELKMIRALQMRVNTRTQRYAELLKNPNDPIGQAENDELRESLTKLAEKQQRVFEVTRDIVLGKNR